MTDESRRYDRAVMRLAGGLLGAVLLAPHSDVVAGYALGVALGTRR